MPIVHTFQFNYLLLFADELLHSFLQNAYQTIDLTMYLVILSSEVYLLLTLLHLITFPCALSAKDCNNVVVETIVAQLPLVLHKQRQVIPN